jgi:subtilase family serine protease
MKGLIRAAVVTTSALSVMYVAQPAFADQDYCPQTSCYGPAQIQQAYGLPALYARGITGKGVTIAVVDAYGSTWSTRTRWRRRRGLSSLRPCRRCQT